MKRRGLAVLLALIMALALMPVTALGATTVASGYCGGDTTSGYDSASESYKNLSWTLDSEGTLTISGTGKMNNYDAFADYDSSVFVYAPWISQKSSIKKAVIGNGVTSIGDGAFQNCDSLTNVTISNSATSINSYAFGWCYSLTSVTIPSSVKSIGYGAFLGCSLTSVVIPSGVTSIDDWAFACDSLTDVYYGGSEAQWKTINIDVGNDDLTSATIHYNSTPDTPDTPDTPIPGISSVIKMITSIMKVIQQILQMIFGIFGNR